MAKRKQHAWFKKIRGSYLPVSWQGWALYVPFVAFLVGAACITARYAHPLVYAAFQVAAEWVAAAAALTWLAARHSK